MTHAETEAMEILLGLERAAMERWAQGDPDGFLEISADDVSYFDPFNAQRLDGLPALRSLYEPLRGQVQIDRFDFIEPRVQIAGDVAVLTYRFDSHGSEGSMHWNTTEVFRNGAAGWKIIHTHWAFHQPKIAG